MGGYGSGRQHGRPLADSSLRIDLAYMLRRGLARDGARLQSTLHWKCGEHDAGSIGYVAAMHEAGRERLELSYTNTRQGEREKQRQIVHLTYTVPNYGGKRWWMLCPVNGQRVAKLYLPQGGDIFASRKAWQLGYQSQREAARDRQFEKLFQVQRKLGCDIGWGNYPLFKPKGMWQRTWQRHLAEYRSLDRQCSIEMAAVAARLLAMK